MAKDNSITIKDWLLGIGQSPHVGFGDMRNLDIFSKPGVLRVNNLMEKKSSTTITGLPLWIRRNPANAAQVVCLDDAGALYKSTDSGASWSTVAAPGAVGAGQGCEWLGSYVIVARATKLDVYNFAGNTWTNDWQTIDSDSQYHPMLKSANDGKIYGGAGRYIFSIEELTTFDPASGATYTFTQQALDLPKNYRVKCLTELGEKLMIGTWVGSNIYEFRVADIFPWDRSSPSYETPIQLNTNGVNAMLTINNIVYAWAGIDGKVFSCNGVQATPIAQVPLSISNIDGGAFVFVHPGAVMNYKERPFFGLSSGSGVGGLGVWSLMQTPSGNILNFEHTISTGNDGSSNTLIIGSLLPITRDTFACGWRDNTTYGVDVTNNLRRYTSYSAYFESAFYNVGTTLLQRFFDHLEFLLARDLATGIGVKLKYRTKLSDSFTTIGTYDFATLAGVNTHRITAPAIPKTEFVQIRGELTTSDGNNVSPELRSVILN